MTKTETRTQYRATCPICFRDHAVRSLKAALMVQHGYERPEGWHANVGQCTGTDAAHFGTEAGREVAANNARFVRTYAEAKRKDAKILRTKPPVSIMIDGDKYLGRGKGYEQISIDATDYRFAREIGFRADRLENEAKHADSTAAEIEKLVAEWKPAAPRAVEVEVGPTLHAINSYLATKGKIVALCSSYSFSGRGAYKQTTKVRAEVNCLACLKQLAAADADKVVSEKADALIAEMVAKYGEKVRERFSGANDQAIKEIRYQRKDVDKVIRKRATDRLERGA